MALKTLAPRTLTYEDALEWGRRAFALMNARDEVIQAHNFRKALTELGAPFGGEQILMGRFGKTFPAFRADVEAYECRKDADEARVAARLMLDLGPGVEVNAPDTTDYGDVWNRLAGSYQARKDEVEAEERRSITIEVDRPDEPIAIIALGDAHIGSPSTKYPRLLAILEQLKRRDIKVFALSIGDWLDQMIWAKVRFEGRASPLTVPKEIMAGAWWLRQAAEAGRFLGIVAGNHDLMGANLAGFSALESAMLTVRQAVPFSQLTGSVATRQPVHVSSHSQHARLWHEIAVGANGKYRGRADVAR